MSAIVRSIAAAVIAAALSVFHYGTDLPLCEYEDSTNCHWDAGSEGNGIGNSFDAYPLPDGRTLLVYDGGEVKVTP